MTVKLSEDRFYACSNATFSPEGLMLTIESDQEMWEVAQVFGEVNALDLKVESQDVIHVHYAKVDSLNAFGIGNYIVRVAFPRLGA